jgi:hypothetical protein
VGLPTFAEVNEFLSDRPEFVQFKQERHDVSGL